MRKRKKKAQPQKELANRYGRKPSLLIRSSDGSTLGTFDSRRQARLKRKSICESYGLQTYETRIVPNGAQLP